MISNSRPVEAKKVLILYSTVDGHTLRICQHIAERLKSAGFVPELCALTECTAARLTSADRVLLGASIRYGRHRPAVSAFVSRHIDLLEARRAGFFSVNLVARKAGKNTPGSNPYVRKFLRQLNWLPAACAVFGGCLDYPRCNRLQRAMIQLIMRLTGGPTDPNGVFEFTDWSAVDRFGDELISAYL